MVHVECMHSYEIQADHSLCEEVQGIARGQAPHMTSYHLQLTCVSRPAAGLSHSTIKMQLQGKEKRAKACLEGERQTHCVET